MALRLLASESEMAKPAALGGGRSYAALTAAPQGLTHMTFLVPSGTYNYTVSGGSPPGGELYPGSGTVVVNGSDVSVSVHISLSFTCTSSTRTP
jgi:hypothetical protein